MTVLLGLLAAVSFGISDIAGALATRRSDALRVTLGIQLTGLPLILVATLVWPGVMGPSALALGALAGLVGNLGLVLYLRSMAVGPVGVISPVAALVGAGLPVIWGVTIGGDALSAVQWTGILLGLIAVVLVAWAPGANVRAFGLHGPLVAGAAGVLFGFFFVVLDATPPDSGLWPLVAARIAGATMVGAIARPRMTRRSNARGSGPGNRSLVWLAGTTDVLANLLFLTATRVGLLSLASLLTSLYPVVALLLARRIFRERLQRGQMAGVALAVLATLVLAT